MYLEICVSVCVDLITINEKRSYVKEKRQEGIYGKFWRKEREGENHAIVL